MRHGRSPSWRLAVGLVLVPLALLGAAGEAGAEPRRVFIVNSYNPEYFWSARQAQGIKDALEGVDAVYEEFFMDTKRHPGAEWLEEKARECMERIRAFRPDIVFTGDDNATRTVGRRLVGSGIPVVFYGLNADPEAYGLVEPGRRSRPGGNVTGVLERHFFTDAARLLQTVCKANGITVEKLHLITDDTYTSRKLFEYLRGIRWDVGMEVVFHPQIGTFARYRDELRRINRPNNAVFLYNLMGIRMEDGSRLRDREILKWTRDTLRIPTVAFHEEYIREGALLGIPVSGYSQAFQAGLKGRMVLAGIPPGEIPIDAPDRGKVIVNGTTLRRLGLKVPLSILLGADVYQYDPGD